MKLRREVIVPHRQLRVARIAAVIAVGLVLVAGAVDALIRAGAW